MASSSEVYPDGNHQIPGNSGYSGKRESTSHDCNFSSLAEDIAIILESNNKDIEDLQEIFKDFEYFVKHEIDAVTAADLYGSNETLEATVTNFRHELTEQAKRAIVFAGEVSSGKSSIINLLLGYNLLPTAHSHTTAVICRMFDSEEHKIITYKKGQHETVRSSSFYARNNDELKTKLKTLVTSCQDHPEYECIDIFLPIQFLRKAPFFIVDTPGIGENDDFNRQLLEYLPEAAGFIYVVNTVNAGGVQQHGLRDIINAVKTKSHHFSKSQPLLYENQKPQQINKSQSSLFDPKCAVFVCNKWDWVPEDEEDELQAVIIKKLKTLWPGFSPDQALPFSVKKPIRNQRQLVQMRLEKMIKRALTSKYKTHKRWLHDVLTDIIAMAERRLQFERLPNDIQNKNLERLKQMLENASNEVEECKKQLEECIEVKSHLMAAQLKSKLRQSQLHWATQFTTSSSAFYVDELSQLKQETLNCFNRGLAEEVLQMINDATQQMYASFNAIEIKREGIQRKLQHVDSVLGNLIKAKDYNPFFNATTLVAPVVYAYRLFGLKTLGMGAAGMVGSVALVGMSVVAWVAYREWMSKRVIEVPGKTKDQYVKEWMREIVDKTTINDLKVEIQKQLQNSAYHHLNLECKFWCTTQSLIKARIDTLKRLSKEDINILSNTFSLTTKKLACSLKKKVA